jgi:hypothetical protein
MSDCAIKLKNHVSKEVKIVAPQIASNFVSTANVGLGSNYVEVRFESREVGDSQQYPLQAANELERQIISTYPELSKNITIKNSTIQNAKILKLIFPDKIAEKIVDRLNKEQDEINEVIAEESKPLEFQKDEEIFSPEMLQIVKNNHPQLQDGATQLEIQFFNNIKDKNCK